jgi:heat-inducible transcriptional repressor
MEEYIISSMSDQVDVIKPIIEQLNKSLGESEEFYLEGTSNVFDFPEFKKIDAARNFLSILDTKEQVMEILNSGFADDINIHIGSENDREEFKDLSIITFKHMIGNKNFGTIGIIGPKRMDYSKVISVMKYINKKLNEELNDNDTEN